MYVPLSGAFTHSRAQIRRPVKLANQRPAFMRRDYSPLGFSGEIKGEPTEQQLLARGAHAQNLRNIARAQQQANATGGPVPVTLLSPVNDAGQLTVGASLPQATTLMARQGTLTTGPYGGVTSVAPVTPIPVAPADQSPPPQTPSISSAPGPTSTGGASGTTATGGTSGPTPTGGTSGTTPTGGDAGGAGNSTVQTPNADALSPPINFSLPIDFSVPGPLPISPDASGNSERIETTTIETAGANGPWWLIAAAVGLYFLTRKRRMT